MWQETPSSVSRRPRVWETNSRWRPRKPEPWQQAQKLMREQGLSISSCLYGVSSLSELMWNRRPVGHLGRAPDLETEQEVEVEPARQVEAAAGELELVCSSRQMKGAKRKLPLLLRLDNYLMGDLQAKAGESDLLAQVERRHAFGRAFEDFVCY